MAMRATFFLLLAVTLARCSTSTIGNRSPVAATATTIPAPTPKICETEAEPCSFDQDFLDSFQCSTDSERLENDIYFIAGMPFLRTKEHAFDFPLTSLEKMADSKRVQPAPDIDPMVSRYRDYIESNALSARGRSFAGTFTKPRRAVDNRRANEPVRDQARRRTCVAFASVAALERLANVSDLSEESAYHDFVLQCGLNCCKDPDVITTDAVVFLQARGVPVESEWRYDDDAPGCVKRSICGLPHQPTLAMTRLYGIDDVLVIGRQQGPSSINNTAYLESLIDDGHDIVLGMFVVGINETTAQGIIKVHCNPDTHEPYCPSAGHALLLLGYDADQGYFIAKDSRGTGWGHNGYLYLSYDYIRAYAKYGFVVKSIKVTQ
jgi:hypothetical protein